MKTPNDALDAYQETIARLEPDIHMIDAGAFYASAAISLKRIADVMTKDVDQTLINCITKAVTDRSGLSYNIAHEIGRIAIEYYTRKEQ